MKIYLTNYEKLIYEAEKQWYIENHAEAVKFYKLALKEQQVGRITQKSVLSNIVELQDMIIEELRNKIKLLKKLTKT